MTVAETVSETELGYQLVDADNHYYEPYDFCTRYLEPEFADRAVNVRVDEKGLGKLYFGDRQFRFIRVIQADYHSPPGSLRQMLDNPDNRDGFGLREIVKAWDHPETMRRDARIALMNQQGVQTGLMIGTTAMGLEYEMWDDVPALYANIRSYNRWVDDEWGFDRDGRIIAAALISLIDPERAVAELDRLIAAGVRAVILKPGPLWGRSPVDPVYDGFWSRLQDADVKLVFHSADTRYTATLGAEYGEDPMPPFQAMSAFHWFLITGKPVADTLASYVLNNLFVRFPGVKVIALECGVSWVEPLLRDIDHAAHMSRRSTHSGEVIGRPSEVLLEHLYVSPFFEDDVVGLVRTIGPERVLFGSDYPHAEGVAEPIDFLQRLEGLTDAEIRSIMRDNTARLFGVPG